MHILWNQCVCSREFTGDCQHPNKANGLAWNSVALSDNLVWCAKQCTTTNSNHGFPRLNVVGLLPGGPGGCRFFTALVLWQKFPYKNFRQMQGNFNTLKSTCLVDRMPVATGGAKPRKCGANICAGSAQLRTPQASHVAQPSSSQMFTRSFASLLGGPFFETMNVQVARGRHSNRSNCCSLCHSGIMFGRNLYWHGAAGAIESCRIVNCKHYLGQRMSWCNLAGVGQHSVIRSCCMSLFNVFIEWLNTAVDDLESHACMTFAANPIKRMLVRPPGYSRINYDHSLWCWMEYAWEQFAQHAKGLRGSMRSILWMPFGKFLELMTF